MSGHWGTGKKIGRKMRSYSKWAGKLVALFGVSGMAS
jgi:hypothetical protein